MFIQVPSRLKFCQSLLINLWLSSDLNLINVINNFWTSWVLETFRYTILYQHKSIQINATIFKTSHFRHSGNGLIGFTWKRCQQPILKIHVHVHVCGLWTCWIIKKNHRSFVGIIFYKFQLSLKRWYMYCNTK